MRLHIQRPWLGEEGSLTIEADRTVRLFQAIWLSGQIEPIPLCGGIGRCGRCRVRFAAGAPDPCDEERQILGETAVSRGWRLSCRCQIPDKEALTIELAKPQARHRKTGSARFGTEPCVLAVDVGTTSVAWRLLSRETGQVLGHGEDLNPQAGAGADVISRIALALKPEGGLRLARIIRAYLQQQIRPFGDSVKEMVVAANTAMTEIMANTDVHGLAGAPYHLSLRGNETLSFDDLPPVYIPPLPAPFVGGDVTAGLLWLEKEDSARPYLLADLGTNGEIALVTADKRLFITSVPLGPALEGIGLECGALAGPDVLTQFSLGPMGLAVQTATGRPPAPGAVPTGISATGFLSLIELLLQAGLMDDEGHLWEPSWPMPVMPLAKRLVSRIDRHHDVPRFMVTDSLWISLRDIEEILKVKAAFCVAVRGVLARSGVHPRELKSLAIAGALGRYVRPQTLERLGFVPAGTASRVRTVGNSSLEGACLLATRPEYREELASLCAEATLLTPAQDPSFHNLYLEAMRFAWTLPVRQEAK